MKLTESTLSDIKQLTEWIASDSYHKVQGQAEWWLTGNGGLLSFCLQDEKGPLCYVRLDAPYEGLVRLHTQFGPIEEVSKIRLVRGMLKCIPIVIDFSKNQGALGIIFNSVSPTLIAFMSKYGFRPTEDDDFVLLF